MLPVHWLVDQDALDDWCRSVQRDLTALLDRANSPKLDIEWLLLRCRDTARYEPGEVKYQSVLHLIEELERFATEFPDMLPADITVSARSTIDEAARKRFLNG